MTTLGNTILLTLFTTTLAVTLVSKGQKFPNKQPLEPMRERIEFCSLLEQEMKLNQTAGLITKERAEAVVTNCFNTY